MIVGMTIGDKKIVSKIPFTLFAGLPEPEAHHRSQYAGYNNADAGYLYAQNQRAQEFRVGKGSPEPFERKSPGRENNSVRITEGRTDHYTERAEQKHIYKSSEYLPRNFSKIHLIPPLCEAHLSIFWKNVPPFFHSKYHTVFLNL